MCAPWREIMDGVETMRGTIRFLRDDRGSETIQFVSWVPLIAFLLVIVTDASFLYLNHSEMTNVARDTARRLTTGSLQTDTDARNYALGELARYAHDYEVEVLHDPDNAMIVLVSVPVVEVATFGHFVAPVIGERIKARVAMRSDPNLIIVGGGNGKK